MIKRIIIGPAYPLRGGISESNQSLHSSFLNIDEGSLIISYSLQYPNFLFPGKSQFMPCSPKDDNSIIPLINSINPISWYKAAIYIVNQKPDYVIVRYWHPYFALCLFSILSIIKIKSIPVVSWVDNVNPHEKFPFQSFLNSIFFSLCDIFVVMSKSVKSNLLKYKNCQNKVIKILPHPVYNVFGSAIPKIIAKKNLHIDVSERCILFFGMVRKYKGLDLLLDAMSHDNIKSLNLKLIIAGEFYESKKKYLIKIRDLDLHNNIIINDSYIENKDVVNYFCASDLVVQPYLSATQSGVSMVAYNFNKPMLLTNVGGLSDYIKDQKHGYLVSPDAQSVASALFDFYHKNREKSFVSEIKLSKSMYSWDGFSKKIDDLYKSYV